METREKETEWRAACHADSARERSGRAFVPHLRQPLAERRHAKQQRQIGALGRAVRRDDEVMARALLEHGARLEAASTAREAPLACAAGRGLERCLRLLLEQLARLDGEHAQFVLDEPASGLKSLNSSYSEFEHPFEHMSQWYFLRLSGHGLGL